MIATECIFSSVSCKKKYYKNLKNSFFSLSHKLHLTTNGQYGDNSNIHLEEQEAINNK